jgi:hypothetical protein
MNRGPGGRGVRFGTKASEIAEITKGPGDFAARLGGSEGGLVVSPA